MFADIDPQTFTLDPTAVQAVLDARDDIAAGAVVTADVPPGTLAVGVPARHRALPTDLEGGNDL